MNLQSKEHLNLFLHSIEDLLDRMFHAVTDIPMMIVNGNMKIEDVNSAFLSFFEIGSKPEAGANFIDLQSNFWNEAEVKKILREVITTNIPVRQKKYIFENNSGVKKTILIDTKIILMHPDSGRKIYVIVDIT